MYHKIIHGIIKDLMKIPLHHEEAAPHSAHVEVMSMSPKADVEPDEDDMVSKEDKHKHSMKKLHAMKGM